MERDFGRHHTEFSFRDPEDPNNYTQEVNPQIEHYDAFSRNTKRLIVERAIEKYGRPASEISGRDDMPLQAAHIDHDRSNPHYDDPDNGVLMTIDEHLKDHILREGENGLTKAGNKMAIDLLSREIQDLLDKEQLQRVVADALREKILRPRPKRIPMGTGD